MATNGADPLQACHADPARARARTAVTTTTHTLTPPCTVVRGVQGLAAQAESAVSVVLHRHHSAAEYRPRSAVNELLNLGRETDAAETGSDHPAATGP